MWRVIIDISIALILLFFIIKKYDKYMKEKLHSNYHELIRVNKELAIAQESLQDQFIELVNKQSELRTSEERYRLAVETANDGLWDWDLRENKCFISEKWKDRLALSETLIENHYESWLGQMHPEDEGRIRQIVTDFLEGKIDTYHVEYRISDVNGKYIWVLSNASLIKDALGNNIRMVGSHSDITARKDYEEKIYRMAYYDGLTNLPNRSLLTEKLEEAINNSRNFNTKGALFFLDLDNFKQINDTLGHDFGDRLLRAVSDRLVTYLGSDFITARLGGDEFIILKETITSQQEVDEIGRKIINLFQSQWKLEENEIFVTISMGSTIFPDDGQDVQKILKNADTAMYSAKDAGKNAHKVFMESMLENVLFRKEMETNLRKAIENNEFKLFYQSYYKSNSKEISGIEALIRWFHPKMGLISPTEFIPIAEETGMIKEIGQWVVKEACRQNKEWQMKGFKKVAVAVNVSTLQLRAKSPQIVANILSESGLEPEWLVFEITESEIMELIDENMKILSQIRGMGVKISLDDFGTGYSSLSYLKMLPLDVVKIDRSFVLDIDHAKNETLIIDDIISIAHKLNLQVIAEGVETVEQMDYLVNQNCDYLQGFYLSKPLSSEQMGEVLESISK